MAVDSILSVLILPVIVIIRKDEKFGKVKVEENLVFEFESLEYILDNLIT